MASATTKLYQGRGMEQGRRERLTLSNFGRGSLVEYEGDGREEARVVIWDHAVHQEASIRGWDVERLRLSGEDDLVART